MMAQRARPHLLTSLLLLALLSGCLGDSQGGTLEPAVTTGPEDPVVSDDPGASPPEKNQTETRIRVDPNGTFAGSAHTHDWWGSDTQYVLMDKAHPTGPGGLCVGAVTFGCNGGAQFVHFEPSPNANERPNNVWLGTGRMELRIRTSQVLSPFVIEVEGPGGFSWSKNRYTITAPDQTIKLEGLTDANADPPHFRSSGWRFRVWSTSPASVFVGPFHWTVTIFRDVGRELPLDPPHPDFWGGQVQRAFAPLRTYSNYTKIPGYASGTGYGTGPNYGSQAKTRPNETVTIGTGRMRVTLSWVNTDTTLPTKPGLEYCPASQPCFFSVAKWTAPRVTQDGATQRVYEFEVRPEDWDSPYWTQTRWQFRWFFDDAQGQEIGTFRGHIDWTIEIVKMGS